MKKYLIILFLLISSEGFCNSQSTCDTISHWKVHRNSKLINQGFPGGKLQRIQLTKGSIHSTDTLLVEFIEEGGTDCIPKYIIKNEKGKVIKTISSTNTGITYAINLKTTELLMMAFNDKSSILKIYFKKDNHSNARALFEVEVK